METIDYMKYYFVTLGERTQLEAENKRLRAELEQKQTEIARLKNLNKFKKNMLERLEKN